MFKNTESDAGDMMADLAALRGDVARLAEKIGELAQHGKQAASQHINEAVGDAQDKIASSAARAQAKMRAAGGDFEASVERNPLTALAIAFAIGMGFGMMSRTRS
jgi:ElaB/YqjD/DUF883 family membrane-anchored ribosome-binding protein